MEGFSTLEAELEESLQCPVCLLIPRALPVPACPAGHIICQACREKVTLCPTCRYDGEIRHLSIDCKASSLMTDYLPMISGKLTPPPPA